MSSTPPPTKSWFHKNASCIGVPFATDSKGILGGDFSTAAMPKLMLAMLYVSFSVQILHIFLRRFNLPQGLIETLGGIALGRLADIFNVVVDTPALDTLTLFGFTIAMFITGVKTDMSMITLLDKKALVIGACSLVVPLALGQFVFHGLAQFDPLLSSFIGITSTLTSLGIINSDIGRLLLGIAILTDLPAFFTNLYVQLFVSIEDSHPLAYIIVIIISVAVVLRSKFFKPITNGDIFWLFLAAIVVAALGQTILIAVFAPYVLGLVVPDGPKWGSKIVDKLEFFFTGFLTPMQVFLCGYKALGGLKNMAAVNFKEDFDMVLLMLVLKFLTVTVSAMCLRLSRRDALIMGFTLNMKAEVDLVWTRLTLEEARPTAFVCKIFLYAATTGIGSIFINFLYDPLKKYVRHEKRNITRARERIELRILVCIHRDDQIKPFVKLLEATGPTTDRPIILNVLHLIKLIGRSAPLFISHDLQKIRTITETSYSEPVILAFNNLEHSNRGALNADIFTSISLPEFMYEDICSLALDKLSDVVIFPFHQRWADDGSLLWKDAKVRAINQKVSDIAPCSVGILVDRSNRGPSSALATQPYSVVLLFLGGKDDREALTYAMRMIDNPDVCVTVVHFLINSVEKSDDHKAIRIREENILDAPVLQEFREHANVGRENAIYQEEVVKTGSEIESSVQYMLNSKYDLIITGKRQMLETSINESLSNWNTFPELGTIGDLLVSLDLRSKTSVLIIQQAT